MPTEEKKKNWPKTCYPGSSSYPIKTIHQFAANSTSEFPLHHYHPGTETLITTAGSLGYKPVLLHLYSSVNPATTKHAYLKRWKTS